MTRGTVGILTRHFAREMLSPPILTDLGADYLRRTLFSVLAMLAVIGFFLPRALFRKYANLTLLSQAGEYERAVQADTLMMIAIPMVMVAIVAVLIGPLLFPGETDYRVLTPLPITRMELFAGKFSAIALVATAVVVAVTMVSSVWFPVATGGRGAPLVARVTAHGVASVAGSIWAFLAVMGLQGFALAALPLRWQRSIGPVLQAVLFVGLLWSVPLVIRMPAMVVTEGVVMQAPLRWLPPAWFLGVEQWLLDGSASGGYMSAAGVAAWALAVAIAIVVGVYVFLFRTAERLAGLSGAGRRPAPRRFAIGDAIARAAGWSPAAASVTAFFFSGLARSRLHQFVFLAILGGGVALVIGEVLTARTASSGRMSAPRAAVNAAIAAPLLVTLVCTLGLRAAALWPLDRRATWIFRLTEDPTSRTGALDGVHLAFSIAATMPALLAAIVLQPAVLGSSGWIAAALSLMAALAVVEFTLIDWRRIPFACTYLPGKKNLAYTLGVLLAAYFVYVLIGSNLIRWSMLDLPRTIAAGGWLLALWAALRRMRLGSWGQLPLEFVDVDPESVQVLGLAADERSVE